MAFGGITPVDNSFELLGLAQSASVMRGLFVESVFGKVVFTAGSLIGLWRWVQEGTPRPFFVFVGFFFVFWLLFVMPRLRADIEPSVVEENGDRQILSVDIIRKTGHEELMVNPVMLSMTRAMNGIVRISIEALGRILSGAESFLKEPFLMAKLSLETSEAIERGIPDQDLRSRMQVFYQDHYLPAVREAGKRSEVGRWPGSKEVMALYTDEGRALWEKLSEELFVAVNGTTRIFERSFEVMENIPADKEAVVRGVLETDVKNHLQGYALIRLRKDAVGMEFSARDEACGSSWRKISMRILKDWPIVLGGMLCIGYVLVPFIGIIVLTGGAPQQLGNFLVHIGILKTIPVWLALIDGCSEMVFHISRMLSGGEAYLWQMPQLYGSAVIGIVVVLAGLFLIFVVCIRRTRNRNKEKRP